jgi:hypothetical protein
LKLQNNISGLNSIIIFILHLSQISILVYYSITNIEHLVIVKNLSPLEIIPLEDFGKSFLKLWVIFTLSSVIIKYTNSKILLKNKNEKNKVIKSRKTISIIGILLLIHIAISFISYFIISLLAPFFKMLISEFKICDTILEIIGTSLFVIFSIFFFLLAIYVICAFLIGIFIEFLEFLYEFNENLMDMDNPEKNKFK